MEPRVGRPRLCPMEERLSYTPHGPIEDLQAMLCGTALVALGVTFYAEIGLLTGGTAGAALLLDHVTGWGFGPIFFVFNLPFLALAMARMSRGFLLRTFAAVGLVSLLSAATPHVLQLSFIQPAYGAIIGGALIGTGMLMLFRHKASLGGINLLVLYLQERHGIRAGKVQMAVDCLIVLLAAFQLPPDRVALSILGAVTTSFILVTNHKQGRYLGVS